MLFEKFSYFYLQNKKCFSSSYAGEIITIFLQVTPPKTGSGDTSATNLNVTPSNIIHDPAMVFTLQYSNDYPKPSLKKQNLSLNDSSETNILPGADWSPPIAADLHQPIVRQASFRVQKDSVQALVPIGKVFLMSCVVGVEESTIEYDLHDLGSIPPLDKFSRVC